MHSRRLDVRDIIRCPKFRLEVMKNAAFWAKENARAGYVDSARWQAETATHEARSIMARRELFARVIVATQAREGITTTMDEARAAYDKTSGGES